MLLLKKLAQQKFVQLFGCLFIGVAIGAIFYPSSTIVKKTQEQLTKEFTEKEKETQSIHDAETKKLTDQITAEESSRKQYEQETQQKIQSLTTENDTLKQSTHRQTYKIVKPDGTIIEQEMDSSDTESSKQVVTQIQQEFNQKVQSIEDKYKKIHEDLVTQLNKTHAEELQKVKDEAAKTVMTKESETTVETNKKSIYTEVGITSNKQAYFQANYPLFGPVSLGAGVDLGSGGIGETRVGVGLNW